MTITRFQFWKIEKCKHFLSPGTPHKTERSIHLSVCPIHVKNLMEIIPSGPPPPLRQEILPDLDKKQALVCTSTGLYQCFGIVKVTHVSEIPPC